MLGMNRRSQINWKILQSQRRSQMLAIKKKLGKKIPKVKGLLWVSGCRELFNEEVGKHNLFPLDDFQLCPEIPKVP